MMFGGINPRLWCSTTASPKNGSLARLVGGLLGEGERKNLSQIADSRGRSDLPPITPFFDASGLGCPAGESTSRAR